MGGGDARIGIGDLPRIALQSGKGTTTYAGGIGDLSSPAPPCPTWSWLLRSMADRIELNAREAAAPCLPMWPWVLPITPSKSVAPPPEAVACCTQHGMLSPAMCLCLEDRGLPCPAQPARAQRCAPYLKEWSTSSSASSTGGGVSKCWISSTAPLMIMHTQLAVSPSLSHVHTRATGHHCTSAPWCRLWSRAEGPWQCGAALPEGYTHALRRTRIA